MLESLLVPKLLNEGHDVTVLDLFLYGDNVLDNVRHDPYLKIIKGDIRDESVFRKINKGCDTVIHLACISK